MEIKLFEILKDKNITIYKLSKLSGIPMTTLYSLKDGRSTNLSLINAYKIATILNIKIDDLIKNSKG